MIGLSGYPFLSHAQGSRLDPSRVKWTDLYYKSYILFFPVKASVHFKSIPLARSQEVLLVPKEGQGTFPKTDPSYRMDIVSEIIGRNSLIKLWFDPDGEAFQRTQTETGSKKRIKTYRMLKNGYYWREVTPGENEKDLPPNEWTRLKEGAETFKQFPPSEKVVSEPTALFYLISASSLNQPNDQYEEYILTKHGIFKLNLYAADYKEIEVSYESNKSGVKKALRGKYRTLHIRMKGAPIDPSGKNGFEFLGLKRDIDLYLDPDSRILLQISGVADIIGRMDIKLKQVVF